MTSKLLPCMALALWAMAATGGLAFDVTGLPLADQFLPKNFTKKAAVPQVGELWTGPTHSELAPTYCVWQGHVICVMFDLDATDFRAHKSFANFAGLKGLPPADHVDEIYFARGEGNDVPGGLYRLALYFVSEHDLSDVRP